MVFGTGSARATQVTGRVGSVPLELVRIERLDSGFENLFLRLPVGHGLTGAQFLQITAGGRTSNRVPVVIQ